MSTTITAATATTTASDRLEDHFQTARLGNLETRYLSHGEGPPLLLLHGFTGAGLDWRHLFDLDGLARQWRLIVPDLRGHGGSNNPGGAFSHRQCAGDVLALLDHLKVGRCRAIGLSLGGNILLHLATRQPDRVQAMVTVSSPSYFPREARAIMAKQTDEGRSDQEWAEMRGRHRLGDEQIRALWRQARAFADSHDDMCFTPPLLATITARTLIVSGDRDPLYPLEIFVEQYRAIPRASLYVVPDGGHLPIFSEARAEFVRVALAFLASDRSSKESPGPQEGAR
jgi:pimeloyl-ACP methyl ester carboxylesterase